MEKLAEEADGDVAKFEKKNATQIMSFLPHFCGRKLTSLHAIDLVEPLCFVSSSQATGKLFCIFLTAAIWTIDKILL